VSMGRGGAGRGGGQTSAERKQKSRAAVRARSSTVTAGAASGLAVQGTVASPADVVADAVASPAEETPADVYSSPEHKMWRDKDTCPPADLTALSRGPKSWSWTIKVIVT
jgi:hypothetical protein